MRTIWFSYHVANEREARWVEELSANRGKDHHEIDRHELPKGGKLEGRREDACCQQEEQDKNGAQCIHEKHRGTLLPAIDKDTGNRSGPESGKSCSDKDATHGQRCPPLLTCDRGSDPEDQCVIEDDIAQLGNGLSTPQESEITVDEQPTFSGCLSRGCFAVVHTDLHAVSTGGPAPVTQAMKEVY